MRGILKEYNVKTAGDINHALKDMFGGLLQEALEAELDTELGYPKNGQKPEPAANRRNGHTKKTVRSEHGEIALCVPRDRTGEFEPAIVKKHQKEVTGIEDQILALYAKGVSVRDIQDHLSRLYGVDVSPTLISNVTSRIMPLIREWQSRPLQKTMLWCFWTPFTTRSSRRVTSSTRLFIWSSVWIWMAARMFWACTSASMRPRSSG